MSTTLIGRIIPVGAIPSSRFRHVLFREVLAAKAWAITIISGFFEPVFYLFSLGVGLGGLIGTVTYQGMEVDFVQFVAPGLLAASAMNGAIFESTMNCYYKLTMAKTFDAMLQTPLQPGDVAAGEIAYAQARGTMYSAVFLTIMAVLGYVASPWGILALPVCMLIGFAFSAFGLTLTTYMRSWADFDLIFTATLPVFLLSTTFFPIEVYPVAVRPIVWLSPLYHGVELVRAATLGVADWTLAVHLAVLIVLAVVGTIMTGRRLEKLLLR